RAIVAESRDAARAILDEARAHAVRLQAESEAQAKANAAAQTNSIIASATRAAEAERAREAEVLAAVISAAEKRVDGAVADALRELVG
ncbi:MAG: hypothetical protein WBI63_05400, partial [Coriobacteriia bacterium]